MKKQLLFLNFKLQPSTLTGIVLIALMGAFHYPAQAQNWNWARKAGGIGLDQSRDIAADAFGNVYVVGYFGSMILTIGPSTLNNQGENDIYIIKYDSAGTVLWAKSAGGTGSEGPNGIAVDASGNVYIAGVSNSPTLTFGTITLQNTGGGANMFVARFDSTGNAIWAKSAGGSSTDEAYAIDTDASGNVYVCGFTYSSSITFGGITVTSSGSADGFIAKYDSSGNILWAKSIGGSGGDRCMKLSTDNSGNLFVAGTFSSPSLTVGTTTLTNVVGDDIFIVKYDTAGAVLWAKSAAGPLADAVRGISVDASGNVYIGGFFNSSSITFGTITLPTAGPLDAFLAKYDPAGNVIWAKSAGSANAEFSNGIATDANGNTTLIGYFKGPSLTVGSTTLINSGPTSTSEVMIIQYDSSGTVLWAKSAGGSGEDLGYGICADLSGNVYITGNYESASCSFGPTSLSNSGISDAFVAKINGISTDINEINSTQTSIIYPNPATDQITVQLSGNNNPSQVIVSDLAGRIVFFSDSAEDKTVINTANYSAGVYSVKISSQNFSETKKLIIVR